MPKMVIEVPDEFVEVGKAMAKHLAMLQRTVDRLGGGKAVDYGAVEAAVAEEVARTELAAHRAILQKLDIDVPAVVIGGIRLYASWAMRGCLPHDGRFSIDRTIIVSAIGRARWTAWWQGGGCGESANRGSGRWLAAANGASHGACGTAGHVARGGGDGQRVWTAAVLPSEFRAGSAHCGGSCGCGPSGHRRYADRRSGSS